MLNLFSRSNEIDNWLLNCPYVKDHQMDIGILITKDNITLKSSEYDTGTYTILYRTPQKYNLVLDGKNEPITKVNDGEIALSYNEANRNNLKIGDKITITLGNKEKTLTLALIVKDMLFGSPYLDPNRLVISDNDYDFFLNSDEALISNLYSVLTHDTKAFVKDLQKQKYVIYYHFDKETLNSTFTMEMVQASIMIIVSICLIAIALIILRFTIVFTLQDDFREIGVMKAIGLRNHYIKKIYIIKYLALATIGSVMGVIISVPFSNMMTDNIKNNIAMESSSSNLFLNILCGLFIITIVVFFCYLSAGKVNKFTAIQAIRGGSTGERFTKQRFFSINKTKMIPIAIYLALNSIVNSFKSYIILFLAFILGTLLVILPLNAVNTLNSDEIINYFSTIKTDIYFDNLRSNEYIEKGDTEYMLNDLSKLKELYKENGIDIEFNVMDIYLPIVYVDNPDEAESILGMHSTVFDISEIKAYLEGTPPILPNEIAMTDVEMKRLDLVIGDSVNIIVGDIHIR